MNRKNLLFKSMLFVFLFANGWAFTNKGRVLKYGDPIVSVDKPDNSYPDEYIIYQNYPNPFNPTTTIRYTISTSPQSPPLLTGRQGKRSEAGVVRTIKSL